jgi:hypothetical protein
MNAYRSHNCFLNSFSCMYLLDRVCSFWRFGQRNWQILNKYRVGFLGNQFIGSGWRSSSCDKGNSRKHDILGYRPGLVALTRWQRSLFFMATVFSEKVEDTTWTVAIIFTVLQKEADLWLAAKMSVAGGVLQPPGSRTPQSWVATHGKRATSFSLPSTTSKRVL